MPAPAAGELRDRPGFDGNQADLAVRGAGNIQGSGERSPLTAVTLPRPPPLPGGIATARRHFMGHSC